eukprot:COSAG04_NODE_11098_length_731_cov_0.895570_1_plen_64_part_10
MPLTLAARGGRTHRPQADPLVVANPSSLVAVGQPLLHHDDLRPRLQLADSGAPHSHPHAHRCLC